jgi:hypothetical protein
VTNQLPVAGGQLPEPKERARYQAAMSFEEIGHALGITRGGAWMLYRSALRKLRRRRALKQLLELSYERQQLRTTGRYSKPEGAE